MRRLAIAAITLLLASTAFGQQKNDISVFLSRVSVGGGPDSGASTSFGAAFSRKLTPRISAQIAVASEEHHSYSYIVNPSGTFAPVPPVGFHTYPIDLGVRYHFLNDTRWKPYVGLGLRYVAAPNVSTQFRYQNHLGPEIVGGTTWEIGRSFALVFDGKLYLGDREHYDSQFKPSLGLNWRF